jgi:uncharacterized membrane protein
MNITAKKIFLGIFLLGLLFNLSVVFNIQTFFLSPIFSFTLLMIIPGLLTMLMLKIRLTNFWEYMVHTVCLSLAFMIFGGLFLNGILPIIGIKQPLSFFPLLVGFDLIWLLFWFIAYIRNKDIRLYTQTPRLNQTSKIMLLLAIIFPIPSIIGATILNNNGSNFLTLIMLCSIAVYVFLIIKLQKKYNKQLYPWIIYLLGLSLLLMYSWRSWHILGWDINREYLVFQLTNLSKYWDLQALNNAYNLCLSITILPTIFSTFLNINTEYIYKLIFPIIFSIVPVINYLLARKILDNSYAFLSSLFFISQIWFFEQIPALARQEISLIFFAEVLLLAFDQKLNQRTRKILLVIMGSLIILSHYSTAYIWMAIMIIYLLVAYLAKFFIAKSLRPYFSLKYIVFMIFIAFFWESQLAVVSESFTSLISNTVKNITQEFSADMINKGIDRLTFKNLAINTDQNVYQNFIAMTIDYQDRGFLLYPEETYADYSPKAIFSDTIQPLTSSKLNIVVGYFFKISKIILVNLIPFIGIYFLLKKYLRLDINKKLFNSFINRNIHYLLLSVCTLPLISLIIFIPLLKIEYDITRLYIQSLIILAPLTILGGRTLISKFCSNTLSYSVLGIVLGCFFLYSTGIVNQIIGGSSFLHLNNFGEQFDKYYITQKDIQSAQWLSSKRTISYPVYADEVAGLRLASFGSMIDFKFDILPSTIEVPSYVYLSQTNVQKNKVYKRFEIDFLAYTTPLDFLDSNKSLIYNNGGSRIYK